MSMGFVRAPRRVSSVRRVLARRRLWPAPGAGLLVVLLALALGLSAPPAILAAPPAQAGSGPSAGVSYLHHQPGTGPFGQPRVTAYVQVFDRADPPIGRAPVTGLAPTAFSATEDGRPVSLTVRPAAPDEPVALIVVADTNTGREWLPAGPKYADPLLYLRDASTRVLREFPQNGRYAVYTMAGGAAGTPPLGDRATAEAERRSSSNRPRTPACWSAWSRPWRPCGTPRRGGAG